MIARWRPEPEYMRAAVRAARRNLRTLDGGPFGACIVRDGTVLAVARNTVLRRDATCHAEINAIRAAARKAGTHDLSGAVIYSTTEPCPMCFGAIHWAGIGTIVSGADIAAARRAGFRELAVSNRVLKRLGRSRIRLVEGFLREECLELFAAWSRLPDSPAY